MNEWEGANILDGSEADSNYGKHDFIDRIDLRSILEPSIHIKHTLVSQICFRLFLNWNVLISYPSSLQLQKLKRGGLKLSCACRSACFPPNYWTCATVSSEATTTYVRFQKTAWLAVEVMNHWEPWGLIRKIRLLHMAWLSRICSLQRSRQTHPPMWSLWLMKYEDIARSWRLPVTGKRTSRTV